MGKHPPNLRLVSGGPGESVLKPSSGFDFITIDELSSSEKAFTERLIAAVCPSSGIIAVARCARTWDLRPVVALSGEEGPSIIRLTGPDISFSKPLQDRVRGSLERLNRFTALQTELRGWGEFEGQLWIRRTLVPSTLAHDISGGFRWEPEQIYQLIHKLFEAVAAFHSHGLVHGHIATTNIVYSPEKGVSLLDPAIGAALVQAESDAESPQRHSVAPEIPGNGQLQASADCYGLGQVSKRLLLKLRRKCQFMPEYQASDAMIEQLLKIVAPMVAADPGTRPALPELLAAVEQVGSGEQELAAAAVQQAMPTGSGKILVHGRVEELPMSEHDDAAVDAVDLAVDERFTAPVSEPAVPEKITTSDSPHVRPQEQSGSMWWVYVLGFATLLFCIWTVMESRRGGSAAEYTIEELRFAWESSIPSRMAPVAELALQEDGQVAEDLIIRSIYNGARLPQGVNADLVRTAFDARWERRLTEQDRRMVLALGVAGLLSSNYPKDLGPLEERHPGVIYAVVATSGPNADPFLERIPAMVLEKLPGSLGRAFAVLTEHDSSLTSASPEIRRLAKFSTRGPQRTTEVADFVATDTEFRLKSLARLYERSPEGAQAVLDIVLQHPNLSLQHPLSDWARKWELMNWVELDIEEKLGVLAGIPPSSRVTVENIGKMFAHPAAAIRGYAVEQAIDRIRFAHPGSFAALRLLAKEPESLSGKQLFELAKFLENPQGVDETSLQQWFASKPALTVAVPLLMSGTDQKSSARFDTFLAMYLKLSKWQPTAVESAQLIKHPDEYARLFAYQDLFRRGDAQSLELLESALEREGNRRYQAQLKEMIAQLKEGSARNSE